MAKEEIILDFKVDEKDAVVSIENLAKANKELREERKKLDLQTEKGKQRAQEINKVLDQNTKVIKENVSALEKQRLNIGNYGSALDKLAPGLSGMIQGIQGGTKAALAFIATPIGAVIGALGLAVGALTSYFKGSEEGQNNFNKVVRSGTIILGNLLDIVRDFGGALFKVFSGDFKGAAEDLRAGFDGIKTIVEDTNAELAKGDFISALEAETDVLERQLIVLKGVNEGKIAKLKLDAEDKSLSNAERQAALNEALRLQNELSDKQVQVAKNRLTIVQETNKLSDSTKEDLLEEANLTAALGQVEKERNDRSKEIFTKNQQLQKESLDLLRAETEAKRNIAFEEEQAELMREANHQRELERINERIQTRVTEEEQLRNRIAALDLEAEFVDESVEANQDYEKELKRAAIAEQFAIAVSQARTGVLGNLSNLLAALGQQNKELLVGAVVAEKAASISQIASNTGIANAKAVAASPLTLGQPFVTINTISGVLAAAATVASAAQAISQITKAAGGGSFETNGPHLMLVGDNPGGRERVDVTPISGRGQTRVGSGITRMAGGGSLVANSSSQRIDQSMGLGNLMKGLTVQASWVEGQELGKKIEFKESLVTA